MVLVWPTPLHNDFPHIVGGRVLYSIFVSGLDEMVWYHSIIVNDVENIGMICREKDVPFHTDAVQAAAHISMNVLTAQPETTTSFATVAEPPIASLTVSDTTNVRLSEGSPAAQANVIDGVAPVAVCPSPNVHA